MGETKKTRGAFSLLELIAVVAIVGIIAAILVPRIVDSSTTSKAAVTANDIRILANACIMYRVEHGEWPRDVNRGRTPAELNPFFATGENVFGKECPLGGVYDWNGRATPRSVEILSDWSAEDKVAVDTLVDDGDLSTGSFRDGRRWGVEYLCF